MRLLLIACSMLLSACGWRDRIDDGISNQIDAAFPNASPDSAEAAASYPPDPPVYPAKLALFDLPESTLLTECSAGAAYPDGKVQPGFYAYPPPPENDRYMDCLLAEAQRDGGKRRLASPKSFPAIGTCHDARITDLWPAQGARREGSSFATFDNALSLWDYGHVPQLARSRAGDPVRACVRNLPKNCPGHDLRGIGYRLHNLRTGERWTMGNSQHLCRGA